MTAIRPSLDVWRITTDRGLGEWFETAMPAVTAVSLRHAVASQAAFGLEAMPATAATGEVLAHPSAGG